MVNLVIQVPEVLQDPLALGVYLEYLEKMERMVMTVLPAPKVLLVHLVIVVSRACLASQV